MHFTKKIVRVSLIRFTRTFAYETRDTVGRKINALDKKIGAAACYEQRLHSCTLRE